MGEGAVRAVVAVVAVGEAVRGARGGMRTTAATGGLSMIDRLGKSHRTDCERGVRRHRVCAGGRA